MRKGSAVCTAAGSRGVAGATRLAEAMRRQQFLEGAERDGTRYDGRKRHTHQHAAALGQAWLRAHVTAIKTARDSSHCLGALRESCGFQFLRDCKRTP